MVMKYTIVIKNIPRYNFQPLRFSKTKPVANNIDSNALMIITFIFFPKLCKP